MKGKKRFCMVKNFSITWNHFVTWISRKRFNRLAALMLITVLLTETVIHSDLFVSGNNKAYAETVLSTGDLPIAGTGQTEINTDMLTDTAGTFRTNNLSAPGNIPAAGKTADTENISDTGVMPGMENTADAGNTGEKGNMPAEGNKSDMSDSEAGPNGENAPGPDDAPYPGRPDTESIPGTGDTKIPESDSPVNPPDRAETPDASEDTEAPEVPGNVTAVVTGSAIFISWEASRDNVGVEGYRIYRDEEEIGTSEETNYTDTSCTEGNTYIYSVKAYDAAGNLSEAGIGMPVTMTALKQEQNINLIKPSGLTAEIRETVIVVRWGSVYDAGGYELSIDGVMIPIGYDTSYVQTQIIPNHTYEYKVRVVSRWGDVSEWSDPVYLTIGPDKVINLNAVRVNERRVELSWDPAEGADSYEIECNGNILDMAAGNSYTHNLAEPASGIFYRVRAVSGEIKGIWSDPVSLSTEIIIPGGTIDTDTVWDGTAGIYLVQGDITIAAGAALRLMPGTIIKFQPAVGMRVKGNLTAEGTGEQPVIITSEKDPRYGGSGISEYEDYFTGIYVEKTGEFTGDYVRISYGGGKYSTGYYSNSTLTVEGKLDWNHSELSDSYQHGILADSNYDVTVQNSVIENSGYYNIYIDRWYSSAGTVTIRNNIIQNGMDGGIYVDEDEESSLIIENNTIQGNTEYGICIKHGTWAFQVSGNNILNNTGFPLYIDLGWIKSSFELEDLHNNNLDGNNPADLITLTGYLHIDFTLDENYMFDSLVVNDEATLTLRPGTVLYAPPGRGSIGVAGKMNAKGTAEEPVLFTSVLDEEYGGSGITGTDDYWGEIQVYRRGEFTAENIKVKYAWGSGGALYIQGKLYLNHSEITGSQTDGITIDSSDEVTIQNSIIEASQSANIGIGDYEILPASFPVTDSEESRIKQEDPEEIQGTITIRNNILRNASYSGVFICKPRDSRVIIENNTIENNNDYPVRINLRGTWTSEAISNISGNLFKGNLAANRICLYNELYTDLTLPKNEYDYEIEGRITIPSERALTIQPGAVLLMNSQSNAGIEIEGKLITNGTETEKIVFTLPDDPEYGESRITGQEGTDSLKIDPRKGKNKAAAAGEGSKWEGIRVKSTGEFTGSNVIIRNGGHRKDGYDNGALYVEGKLNLYYSEVTGSYDYGIYFDTAAQPVLFYNSFADNSYAVYNANDGMVIPAAWNYWNSIYGPTVYRQAYDPVEDTWTPEWTGNGEKIYGKVDYSPYLGFDMTGSVHFGQSEGAYAPTGNYSKQFMDLSVDSPEGTLTFTRLYNSQNTDETGVFGKGWSLNYESAIRDSGVFDSVKTVALPDGSYDSFTQNADGSYTANSSRNTLVKQPDGTYILTTKEQIKYGFNADGILTWTESKEGNRLSIRLTPEGKPESITDCAGREYLFTYKDGLLAAIADPELRTANYYYENGRLAEFSDPIGVITYYGYDADGYLIEISDGNHDLTESVTYRITDGIAQVDQVTDVYGNVKTYTYDDVSGKTIITDSNGNTTAQWYDTTYNITYTTDAEGRTRTESYTTEDGVNKYGEIKSVTDRNGNTTACEWDDRGNITKVTNPDSSYRLYTYDGKNNITSEREEEGRYTYYIYDETQTYLLKTVRPLNGTDAYSETANQDAFAITSYTYYGEGEETHIRGFVKSVTDPEGNTSTYTYDAYGNLESETDGSGHTTSYSNSIIGFRTSALSPKGELTTYVYNNNGNPELIVTDGGETTWINYDELGRKVQEIAPNINQGAPGNDIGYRYTYYKSGMLRTVTDPEDYTTTYTYDLYGNLSTETKPNGCIYLYEYDALNRIMKEYVQDSEASEKVLLKSYTYDILPDRTTQIRETVYLDEAETADTIYVYDYADRPVEQVNPDGGVIYTEYTADGKVYFQTDAVGNATYYRYDGLNRLAEKWTPFENGRYTYQEYSYDKNGNTIAEKIGTEPVPLWDVSATLLTTAYTYDRNNRVASVTDPENGKTEYEYDANGNRSKETVYLDENKTKVTEYEYSHFGKPVKMVQHVEAGDIYGNTPGSTEDLPLVTTYTYDAVGNVIRVSMPDYNAIEYDYDRLNRPIAQIAVDTNDTIITEAVYDFSGNIVATTDGNGNVTQNIYNQRGMLEKTLDPMGGTTAYFYDRAGRLTAKVLPENYKEFHTPQFMASTLFFYDKMNRIILEQNIYHYTVNLSQISEIINTKANKYDYNGNVIKTLDALGYERGWGTTITEKIDSGYGTVYTYNDANLLITTLSPDSYVKELEYDIRYEYDAAGQKISEINGKGIATNYKNDNAGRMIKTTVRDSDDMVIRQVSYDRMGNVLTETDGNGNTTSYTYNRLGLVKRRTTPVDASEPSNTTVYQYDGLGRQVYWKDSMGKENIITYNLNEQVVTHTERKEDGTQSITVSNDYDRNGNLRFATDANGFTTEYEYDGLNRLVLTRQIVAGRENVTTNTYDKNSNLLTETDWLGNTYINEYDTLNRLVKRIDPDNFTIEKYEYNNNNFTVRAYDALDNKTEFEYDKNNRLVKTTDPEGRVTSQTYDAVGNIAAKSDGKGNITAYDYDALNRLVRVTNAKGEVTDYTYDLNGNLLTQTDGNSNTTTYTYNTANHIIRKEEPRDTSGTRKAESYTYYADGTIRTKTDRNGVTTTYTYDIHGNLLKETAGSSVIIFTYDANGNMLTMTDATGTTDRIYDELGRVLGEGTEHFGYISYEYDITSDTSNGYYRERLTDSKGNVTDKYYDRAGRLATIILQKENDVTGYTYYDNGNRASVIYHNGTKEEYTYNGANQIKTLVNRKADGSILESYTYTYDAAGNQITKCEVIGGAEKGTTTYTYDTLNRLQTITEPNGKVTSYEYDKAGNRSVESVIATDETSDSTVTVVNTYTYDTGNRLTNISAKVNNVLTEVTDYTYDNNGNQLTTVVKTYTDGIITSTVTKAINTYDIYNQLIKTETWDGTEVNNTYNGEGYRIGKEVNGEQTYYLYESGRVILELDETGEQVARNVYGTNLLMRTVNDETYYYLYNGHGDVTALLTREGTIAATYYYDAFGNILESTGDVNNNIRYAGYQYDEETGLYYLNARMYDPVAARFLQEDMYTGDPEDPLSLNLYTYCKNNPIIYWDPSGHIAIPADIGWLRDVDGPYPYADVTYYIVIGGIFIYSKLPKSYIITFNRDSSYDTSLAPPAHSPHPTPPPPQAHNTYSGSSNYSISSKYDPDPYARPGQKKQGREPKEKKKKGDWKPNPNKKPKPLPKHTPGREHRKY